MGIVPVNNDTIFLFNAHSQRCTYDGVFKYKCEDTSEDTINYDKAVFNEEGIDQSLNEEEHESYMRFEWSDNSEVREVIAPHFTKYHPMQHTFAVPSGYC